jgi:endonuclease/exonuclease/phosphatase (EEP) superfamily protein YafD
LGGLCLATALSLLAPLGWPFELFTHFGVQYAAVALVLAALFAVQRRPVGASLAVLLAAFHALPALKGTQADESAAAACGGVPYTVVTANVRYRNTDRSRFLAWLSAEPGDLVLVQEVTPDWARDLEQLREYPYRDLRPREDAYGIGVLSRWPLQQVVARDLAGDGLPSLQGTVAADGRHIRFLGLHTRWPILPGLARWRDATLREAAGLVRASEGPVLVLGDLNVTPRSPVFGTFLQESGLRDVMHGVHWRPTWMAGFWPLSLRIDHVLVSPGVCVEQAEVGPSIGSDHRPVVARLRFQAAP